MTGGDPLVCLGILYVLDTELTKDNAPISLGTRPGGSCPVLSFRAGSPYKPSSPRTTADCKGAKGKPRPWGDQNEQACLPDPLFRAEIRLISSDLP